MVTHGTTTQVGPINRFFQITTPAVTIRASAEMVITGLTPSTVYHLDLAGFLDSLGAGDAAHLYADAGSSGSLEVGPIVMTVVQL